MARRERRPLTPPSSPDRSESSHSRTAADDQDRFHHTTREGKWLSRPETPATGKEPFQGSELISGGSPLPIQLSMPLRFRRAEAPQSLGPATPPSRNRGSCPDQTPLTDFCYQTPSTGTPANESSSHETTFSRISLPMTEVTSGERHGTGVTPSWPPKGRPHRPRTIETALRSATQRPTRTVLEHPVVAEYLLFRA